jgi:transglycosylase-like protein with SLT domain/D-alanyl-D-alanine carboxypeptidase-like protein/putative Flp pilus-assembly TadE/G-like protein
VRGERGQASVLLVGALLAILVGGLVLAALARGVDERAAQQRAADLAALAGARAMRSLYDRLFEPATVGGQPNPRHLTVAAYRQAGEAAARETAHRNGMHDVAVDFPDRDSFAPVRIAVTVRDPIEVDGHQVSSAARAEAELAPPATVSALGEGEYRGPLAMRQGKPMRPDVARAFDRMERAARADGVALIVVSAFRSNAEQAALFARHPDPKWVAPPGKSLHRLGTELDLGPPAAYGWLARNATRFGFTQRYSWEPWHFGYTRAAGTRSVGFGPPDGESGIPDFVPGRFAAPISRAAQRWNVGAALLAAQLYAESNFNPFAQSPAGAQGIAQFMPGTAAALGLENPFDAAQAIDVQAHLMHDLLRQFGSVPLALAAYNAGPAAVQRCGCIPPYPETRGYVARILGLLNGAGDAATGGLEVRLVG